METLCGRVLVFSSPMEWKAPLGSPVYSSIDTVNHFDASSSAVQRSSLAKRHAETENGDCGSYSELFSINSS